MKKNNNFKKIALFSAALVASLPAYAISPAGAAGATAGALVGAYIVGKVISNHHKDKNGDCQPCSKKRSRDESNESMYSNKKKIRSSDTTQSKKAMQQDLKQYKKDLSKHKSDLKKVEKKNGKSNSMEVMQHKSEISKLENMIDDIKQRIENLG